MDIKTRYEHITYDTKEKGYYDRHSDIFLSDSDATMLNLRPYSQISHPLQEHLLTPEYFNSYLGLKQLQWVEALESEEYEQIQGQLESSCRGIGGYCCLGVANKRLELQESSISALWTTYRHIKLAGANGEIVYHPPVTNVKVDNHNLRVQRMVSLTHLNDKLGLTFKQIAELLRNYTYLFFTGPA